MINNNNHSHSFSDDASGQEAPIRMELAVSEQGRICVFHDRPFPGLLEWAEYYSDDRRLTLVTQGGVTNDFAHIVRPDIHQYLEKASQIEAMLVRDGTPADFARIDLVVIDGIY